MYTLSILIYQKPTLREIKLLLIENFLLQPLLLAF